MPCHDGEVFGEFQHRAWGAEIGQQDSKGCKGSCDSVLFKGEEAGDNVCDTGKRIEHQSIRGEQVS